MKIIFKRISSLSCQFRVSPQAPETIFLEGLSASVQEEISLWLLPCTISTFLLLSIPHIFLSITFLSQPSTRRCPLSELPSIVVQLIVLFLWPAS